MDHRGESDLNGSQHPPFRGRRDLHWFPRVERGEKLEPEPELETQPEPQSGEERVADEEEAKADEEQAASGQDAEQDDDMEEADLLICRLVADLSHFVLPSVCCSSVCA